MDGILTGGLGKMGGGRGGNLLSAATVAAAGFVWIAALGTRATAEIMVEGGSVTVLTVRRVAIFSARAVRRNVRHALYLILTCDRDETVGGEAPWKGAVEAQDYEFALTAANLFRKR